MNAVEWIQPDIEGSERYLEKLNNCHQIIGDLGPMVVLGYGYKQFYSDGLYWTLDGPVDEWLPPVGDWDNTDWPEVMERNVPDGTKLTRIPEYLLKIWKEQIPDRIEIIESRDQWDYVLYPDRLVAMKGNKLKSFRQSTNRFRKMYPEAVIIPIKEENIPEVLAFHDKAVAELLQRVDNVKEAEREDQAIRRILKFWGDPNSRLFGFLVKVNGTIASAVVNERINEVSSIGIYQKNNYDFKGVNSYTIYKDAQMQKEMGILIMNIMQDVGVKNLRAVKEHLSPLVYIRKYSVIYHNPGPLKLRDDPDEEKTWCRTGMKLTVRKDGKQVYFNVSGRISAENADLICARMLKACRRGYSIRLDLSDAEYMSAAGLRMLLFVFKIKGPEGFVICGVADPVKEILAMLGYDNIITISGEDETYGKRC